MFTPLHILAFAFLSPWLMAAGAAATSIPIVIHLLNKRKFRVIVWAAMDWLMAAQRRNARRLKFQRWLLLAIRCLAILIIAAGIAQLILRSAAFGSLLGGRRVSVIIWDDSYPMGFDQSGAGAGGANGRNAFELSRRLLSDYIAGLKSDDEVMLIRASSGAAGTDPSIKPTADHQAILSEIAAAKLTDTAADLPAAFDRAREVLADAEKSTRSRQLLLLTDLATSSIHDPRRGAGADNRIEGAAGDKLKKAAQGAAAHATDFSVIDEGAQDQWNIAVTGLFTRRPMVVAGTPTDLSLEVFNGSDQPKINLPVNLLVDGVLSRTVKIPRIEPGNFQTTQATIMLPTVGRHLVEAQLPPDLLPVDDTRRLMLNVRKAIPVLLVDGSPGDAGRTSYGSTFYLYAAYALPPEQASPTDAAMARPATHPENPVSMFAPRIISELELANTPLENFDVVVLSDTGDPGPAMRDSLRQFVKNGGLLMFFPGPRTNGQRLSEIFGDSGAHLLPATLGQPVSATSADQGFAFAPEGFQKNPVMQIFSSADREGTDIGFKSVRTSTYFKLGVPADGSAETVLRYQQNDGTPGDAAVVMKRDAGIDPAKPGDTSSGNVILFASSADMAWNTWGAKPSYLPFMHELTYYGLGRATLDAGAGLTLDVGQPLLLPGDASVAGPWIGPHDSQLSVSQDFRQGKAVLVSSPLKFAGTYGPAAGDTHAVVAVNPETRAADIRYVGKDRFAGALGIDPAAIQNQPAKLLWPVAGDNGSVSWLGPKLVLAALVLFMLETLLALLFSTYR